MSNKSFQCGFCKEWKSFPYFVTGIWLDQLEVEIHGYGSASGHAKELLENKQICIDCKNKIMELVK